MHSCPIIIDISNSDEHLYCQISKETFYLLRHITVIFNYNKEMFIIATFSILLYTLARVLIVIFFTHKF